MPATALDYQPVSRATALQVAVTLDIRIKADIHAVFDFVAAEDVLPKVLTGYGFLPAVVRTSGNTGPWTEPGSNRLVHLADGNTAREQVTSYQRPTYFAYRTSEYTFALKYLATHATGQWWFETDGDTTAVKWTYVFTAKDRLRAIPLHLFARTQWAGYMRTCLDNVRNHFESRAA